MLVGNRPRDVVFSPDSTRAYASAEIGGTISVIDVTQHRVIDTISLGLDSRPVEVDLIKERMGRRPWGVTVSPDGKTVYTANGLSDSVSVIDTECMCVTDQIEAGRGAHSIEVGHVD